MLAKAVSTLDLLSGGRVRISLGVGHAEREFEVLRAPFHERGRMTDEYLAAMIELWTSDAPEYHGTYVDFDGIAFAPTPVQQPHPPIWIGGNSRAAMRRAARHDGWYPWLITAEQLPECLDYIRSLPEFEARTRPFDVAMPLTTLAVSEDHRPLDDDLGRAPVLQGKQATIDAIGQLQEIGVTWTSVPAAADALAHRVPREPAVGGRGDHPRVPLTAISRPAGGPSPSAPRTSATAAPTLSGWPATSSARSATPQWRSMSGRWCSTQASENSIGSPTASSSMRTTVFAPVACSM